MEKIKEFIREYEDIIVRKEKIGKKPLNLYLFGILAFFILSGLTYLTGYLFNLLYQINYLVLMTNIVVFLSYVYYKNLTSRYYNRVTNTDHSVWKMNALHYLYAFSIMSTASMLLSFFIFGEAISIVISIVFLIFAVSSTVLYYFFEKEKTRIKMPKPINTILNGFFIAIVFYTVTLLVQINNIPLSFAIVMPIMLTLIIIKRYIEKRFIVRMKRVAIVGLGIFLIVLSFTFTSSFNYISFYRGEFSFRIIYEQLENPTKVFEEGVTGDVVFYEDDIIVVNDNITFYNDDLEVIKTIPNEYHHLYVMNGRLLANKYNDSNLSYIDLYEYNGTGFDALGSYYGDVENNFTLDDDNIPYGPFTGYTIISGLDDYSIVKENDEFIYFKLSRLTYASTDSFMEEVDGYQFNNIAYHNGHMAFVYHTIFVSKYPSKINPVDAEGKMVLYLADQDEYFQNNSALQSSIVFPKLFRLNNFYYFDGHYYLVGHIEYVNGDKFGKMYVYDEEGQLEFETIYEDSNVAVGEKYIAYGDETLQLFTVDSGTSTTYHLLTGYGLMWFTMCIVALFAVKEIHLNPRRDLEYKVEKKAE